MTDFNTIDTAAAILIAEGYAERDVLGAIDSFLAVDAVDGFTAGDLQVLRDQLNA